MDPPAGGGMRDPVDIEPAINSNKKPWFAIRGISPPHIAGSKRQLFLRSQFYKM
jgi:hypothetical protein